MNLSCPRADSACRRACRSPRLARVISCSTSGLTALAFAWLVLIRSCSISCFDRLASRDLRCAASRLSFPLLRRWRTGCPSVRSKGETAGVEGLDHFLDRLLAEVGDRVQLRLGLADQIAHRLDACPLQAVVRAYAQLELLDEDLVQSVAARGRGGASLDERVVDEGRLAGRQLLDPVGVGEDRQALDEDLGGFPQSRGGLDR